MRNVAGVLTFGAVLVAASLGSGTAQDPGPPRGGPSDRPEQGGRSALMARFEREIWPMMTSPEDAGKACLACHRDDETNTSPLVFSGDPSADYSMLADEGYFERGNPASLLARVGHKAPTRRMPPEPQPAWSRREVDRLRAFVEAFAKAGEGGERHPPRRVP